MVKNCQNWWNSQDLEESDKWTPTSSQERESKKEVHDSLAHTDSEVCSREVTNASSRSVNRPCGMEKVACDSDREDEVSEIREGADDREGEMQKQSKVI